MRLLSVIHNPVYGGAHNELLRQRPGLEAAGWTITALTTTAGGSGAGQIRAGGVPVIEIPLHRLRDPREFAENAALVATARRELRALRAVIRRERADLVQVHGVINPQAAVAAHLEGVAVCWHLYDMVAPMALRRALSPLVVRLADSVTTIGRALVDAHPGVDRMGERLVVTSPPVDLDEFRPDAERRRRARRTLGLPDDALVIGMVGNLFPNKAHLDLLAAVEPLLEAHPGLELRMIGFASPVHPDHARLVRDRAARLGPRVRAIETEAAISQLLPAFDLYVMPSHSEGMPTTVIEAMACALPVVATDVGAVAELVTDGETGLLCPPRSAASLGRALETLIADPPRRAAMGAAGRARVEERFGLARVVERRLRAYELALAYRRARS